MKSIECFERNKYLNSKVFDPICDEFLAPFLLILAPFPDANTNTEIN